MAGTHGFNNSLVSMRAIFAGILWNNIWLYLNFYYELLFYF